MNELAIKGNLSGILKSLSEDELEKLTDALLDKRIKKSYELATENRQLIAKMEENMTRNFKDMSDNLDAISDKNYWLAKANAGNEYYAPKYLGQQNNPSFSPVRMNKLLEFCGIIQFNREPYATFLNGKNPLAIKNKIIDKMGYERFQYKFHQERTWNFIKNRLNDRGLLISFNSCKTKEEIDIFIDNLGI